MTEIYLIRHVQAEGNLYRAMQGSWNGAPTELGYRQREALAERFRTVPVDALYSSDLSRAVVTAGALQKYRALPLHTDKRLRELNAGPWEARFFGDLRWSHGEELKTFVFRPSEWSLPGAETYREVTERACEAVREIVEAHAGETVAVVSHGVCIRCLLSGLLGLNVDDREALPLGDNTAVSHLIYENGVFRADYLNDCSHLAAFHHVDGYRPKELRGEPLRFPEDSAEFIRCYSDAWQAAHGTLRGFEPLPYLQSAEEHLRHEPGAVLRLLDETEKAGLLDLDTRRGEKEGFGWISLLYLYPAYRGQGLGIQLLGRAIMYYKNQGRTALRLHVAEDNLSACAFYKRWGFQTVGSEKGSLGRLLLMEKKLEDTHA